MAVSPGGELPHPKVNYLGVCIGITICRLILFLAVLGFVAEKVYGGPLDEVFFRVMKETLGLTRTCFNPPSTGVENCAVCYYTEHPGPSRCADTNITLMHGVGGSGGSHWTMRDVLSFVKAIMRKDQKLYPAELFDLAEQDYTPDFAEGR